MIYYLVRSNLFVSFPYTNRRVVENEIYFNSVLGRHGVRTMAKLGLKSGWHRLYSMCRFSFRSLKNGCNESMNHVELQTGPVLRFPDIIISSMHRQRHPVISSYWYMV